MASGDTLWGIATSQLGDGNRWGEIYDLNRDQLSDPNLIYSGQVLKLPDGAASAGPAAAPPDGGSHVDPDQIFMTQYRSQYNSDGPSSSANCGPTSLAMAFKAFGKAPPGGNPADPEQFIEQTRIAMTGADDIGSYTDINQLADGARKGGLQSEVISGASAVEAAVQSGKLVVLAGDPTAYEGRFSDAQYSHFDGGHFILVTAIQGDDVTICDPLSRVGPMHISKQELEGFMAYKDWNLGTAVWA